MGIKESDNNIQSAFDGLKSLKSGKVSGHFTVEHKPLWNAVFAVALGVSGLITSEFLPVSLLTPMAKDLVITEGTAGQAISITAVVAMISSLLLPALTNRNDRRNVLLVFCVLQILSNLLVAFAPNFAILLIGRVLLGIGLGGFWGMAAATALRLVPKYLVPRALSIIFGAVSLATVIAAPLGSYLGTIFGWRSVFLVAAALGLAALVWQALVLPSMPLAKATGLKDLLRVVNRPGMKGGMIATLFVFMGYASFFTYLRPFLESVTHVDNDMLSVILLGFGVANLAGTSLAGILLKWNLYRSLALMPLLMAILVVSLTFIGHFTVVTAILVALWGLFFGVIQVGWTAWLTRTVPDDAESGGGVQIAVIQLAISAGAGIGGFMVDLTSINGVFTASTIFTLFASVTAFLAFRKQ